MRPPRLTTARCKTRPACLIHPVSRPRARTPPSPSQDPSSHVVLLHHCPPPRLLQPRRWYAVDSNCPTLVTVRLSTSFAFSCASACPLNSFFSSSSLSTYPLSKLDPAAQYDQQRRLATALPSSCRRPSAVPNSEPPQAAGAHTLPSFRSSPRREVHARALPAAS